MKRTLALTFMGLMLTAIFAACGSSQGARHCDAYGNAPAADQVDLAE